MTHPELVDQLNDRELSIVTLLVDELSNREIANELFLAPSTVKWYVRNINQKLHTKNRGEIVERALELDLLDSETSTSQPLLRNLPDQLTQFIGRDHELDEIRDILARDDMRLLTIVGSGGIGKTRIAIEAAEQQLDRFPQGVHFIGLALLNDETEIIAAIASSLDISPPHPEQTEDAVLSYLEDKQLLLVLDNWEHLIEHAPIVKRILLAAPNVVVIATSRERLNLIGESIYSISGMKFDHISTVEEALEREAIQLLLHAAQRVQPTWEITPENLPHVVRICELTGGMPLGILIAISWLDALNIKRIADEIEKNIDFLSTNMHDVPERQRSIMAVLDYSWNQLNDEEQRVLKGLSIFEDSWMLDDAIDIIGGSMRTILTLFNKSLVQRRLDQRYDIHRLLRQYLHTHLDDALYDKLRHAHAIHYTEKLNDLSTALLGTDQAQTLRLITHEMINISMAWHTCIDVQNWHNLEITFDTLIHYGFYRSRRREEITRLFTRLVDHIPQHNDEALQAFAYKAQVRSLYFRVLNHQTIISAEDMSAWIDHARQQDDADELIFLLWLLSFCEMEVGNDANAITACEEALEIAIATNDQHAQALCYRLAGDIGKRTNAPDYIHHVEKSYDLFNAMHNKLGVIGSLNQLARLVSTELDTAEIYVREALELSQEVDAATAMVESLFGLSNILQAKGDFEKALQAVIEASEIGEDSNHRALILESYRKLYLAYAYVGHFDKSLQLVNDALIYTKHIGSEFEQMLTRFHMGAILALTGDREAALGQLLPTTRFLFTNFPIKKTMLDIISAFVIVLEERWDEDALAEILARTYPSHPKDRKDIFTDYFEQLQAQLRQSMGDDAFEAAWERGTNLNTRATVDRILDTFK